MTYALGHYFTLLQNEFGGFGIFEDKYMPISKERYKLWSFEYLKQKFRKNRRLSKYQEDGALLFTSYQMTASDWELLKVQEISDINYFRIDLMDNREPEIVLPTSIIILLERQKQEFVSEREEFRNRLKKTPRSKSSSTKTIIILIIILGLIYFIVKGL